MDANRPHRQMAVPPTLHARLQIAKAIDSLAAQEAEARARRCSEIGAIRSDLEEIPDLLRKALAEWRAELLAELRKYNRDEPRVPKGNPDGGEWTKDGESSFSEAPSINRPKTQSRSYPRYAMLDVSTGATQTDAPPPFIGSDDIATMPSADSGPKSDIQLAGGAEDDESETRRGAEPFEPTPAQQIRLDLAQLRLQSMLSRIRKIDPLWNPSAGASELSAEGRIGELEYMGNEAEEYLSRLRQLALPRDPRTGELISFREAKTGVPFIDYTTEKLQDILDEVIDKVGPPRGLSPQNYGTKVHGEFAKAVRAAGLRGIDPEDVERTFGVEPNARYGAEHSIRTDASLRDDDGNIITIYDIKTGRGMREMHAIKLRLRTGSDATVPIIEIYRDRDPVWKLRQVPKDVVA